MRIIKIDILRAVAFDLDAASLLSLREALPEWEIEGLKGATASSLTHDWNPGEADLVVVQAGVEVARTLGLCQFLVACGGFSGNSREEVAASAGRHGDRPNQTRRVDAALLVLVPPGQQSLRRAAFAAGADSCLVLPVHSKDVARLLARLRQGNRPGWHTLDHDRAQWEDRWQDDRGQEWTAKTQSKHSLPDRGKTEAVLK